VEERRKHLRPLEDIRTEIVVTISTERMGLRTEPIVLARGEGGGGECPVLVVLRNLFKSKNKRRRTARHYWNDKQADVHIKSMPSRGAYLVC